MNTQRESGLRRVELPRFILFLTILNLPLASAACGSEPLEFSEWTIPDAEGTEVHGYAHVSEEGRVGNHLDLERDLVIGDSGAPEETFYRPGSLAVDGEGRIYVLDNGNNRVQVFDAAGAFLLSFGREGQGPGELSTPRGVGIAGDRVLVTDRSNARISAYTRDGEHLDDHPLDALEVFRQFDGLDDGSLVVRQYPSIPLGVEDPPPVFWTATRRAADGSVMMEYIALPFHLGVVGQQRSDGRARFFAVPMRAPMPQGVFDAEGRLYASQGDRYQILALGPEGEQRWALRVAFGVNRPSEADIEAVLAHLRSSDETVMRDHVSWPEQYPAIDRLLTDGDGNLYVFPHRFRVPPPEGEPEFAGPYAVDVYTPAGERRFAGTINVSTWSAALGDHVYAIETDPDTDEPIVARYRIDGGF